MKEEYVKKEEELIIGKEIADCHPAVLLDAYRDDQDNIVFVTILNFGDRVIQYHFNLSRIDSNESVCDVFVNNVESNETSHYKTVYCETYPSDPEPEEDLTVQA